METENPVRRGWRSRWAAIGAAVAVSFGAGGMFISHATPNTSSSFVPVTPVRVLDTRTGLGLTGVFTSPTSRDLLVTGSIATADGTQVVVPAGTTAVSLNVTVVSPTAAGFLSVRPAEASGAPTTSSLNFSAGQVIPNAVTVQLPTIGGDAGKIEITYNAFEVAGPTTHILVDVVGYYQSTQGGGIANRASNQQIALLQWGRVDFPTGDAPTQVAYDGTSIWVTNQSVDTVSKVNPVTGAKTDIPTGDGPSGLAYDGTSIWVADFFGNQVSKINPTTGTKTDYSGFSSPYGVAYDGTSIWVTNFGGASVSKIDPATGAHAEYPTGSGAYGVAYDGTSIWVTNFYANSLSKINPATGAELLEHPAIVNGPSGLAYDGHGILWIASQNTTNVVHYLTSIDSAALVSIGLNTLWVAFDGNDVWFTCHNDDEVVRLVESTQAKTIYTVGNFPIGIAYDGTNVWVANNLDDDVTRLPV